MHTKKLYNGYLSYNNWVIIVSKKGVAAMETNTWYRMENGHLEK